MPKYFLTQEEMDKSKKELEYLKNAKLKEISELIREAISFGDLKENASYHDAKDRQAVLYAKIAELENKIKNCEIIKSEKITILLNGKKLEIDLGGKISRQSPLGRALAGKKPGETAEFEVNGKKNRVEIVSCG